jgi:ribosomal-protein-alanine N-acetyltransferase
MSNTFPSLHTKRLDLIEIRQRHLADIFKLFSDDRVTRFYNVVTLKKEDEAQKYLDWFRNCIAEKTGIRWGIALKGSSSLVGTVGFNSFARQHRANVGYDLQHEFWNKGYVTEALEAVIGFGFKQLGINRIEAEVMQGNTASERVLKKLGFTKEGTLRDWMYWNEKHYDMNMFSLLRSDVKRSENNGV